MFASSLFTLILHAEAANIPKIKNVRIRQITNERAQIDASTDDANAEISRLTAEVTQDDGSTSTVALTPTNTGLVGTTALVLPTQQATLTLTTFDASNLPLMSFGGTLDATGNVRLVAQTCTARGCESTPTADLDLLATEVFGDTFAIELMGSDTFDVAYATLTLTETTGTCELYDRAGNCYQWSEDYSITSTDYEIGWEAVTTVWSGEGSGLGETNDIKVKAWDSTGNKLESAKSSLGQPWSGFHGNVNVLVSDEDPLTNVGFFVAEDEIMLSVVSEGWTLETAPASAEVAWEGGETWTIPATAYQVSTSVFLGEGDIASESFEVWLDGEQVTEAVQTADRGICVVESQTCLQLVEDASGWWLLGMAYASTGSALPAGISVELVPVYGVVTLEQTSFDLAFADDVAVVFGHSLSWAGVPLGLDVQAQVKLLDVPNQRGKSSVLAKGKVFGQIGFDQEGTLGLSGRDKNATVARGDILIGGDPIDIELTNPDTGLPTLPPVLVLKGNGKGTRTTASSAGQTQQTQLL